MSRKSPNLFLAFQISNPDLISNLRKVHFNCVQKENRLKDFIVPLETAHVTLNVFRVENERLEEAKLILQEAFKLHIKTMTVKAKVVTFKGLDMFDKSVLFAKPDAGIEYLQEIHNVFKKALADNNFTDYGYHTFNPHLTMFQVKGTRENFKAIPTECLKGMENFELGIQEMKELQLLSIPKAKDGSGYYYCEDLYNLAEE
eukprot:GFUD01031490.1.p1 GENE.GFUD01031490.1~~GFUD01031490.1.p1  ORF type:complete len:201 (+),score=53.30 GFUD01031490.1:69-671(+)